MNNLLSSANIWFASMDIATLSVANGLRVRKNDVSVWGTSDEILNDLKEAMTALGLNGKKLGWNSAEDTMEWLLLVSF